MARQTRVVPIGEAASLVSDGDMVGFGGAGLRGRPMALVRAVARRRLRNLHLVGWDGGIDVDLLVGAGCVATVETGSVGLGEFGDARNVRRAVEAGTIRLVERPEAVALDRYRAAAMGLPFLAGRPKLDADFRPEADPAVKPVVDPFTGETRIAVAAVRPDVAIIHAHSADRWGNVALDPESRTDMPPDLMVARAARTVIASVEQIVSDETIRRRPAGTILPGADIACVVEAPYGAHPCGAETRYTFDAEALRAYRDRSSSERAFGEWLDEFVHGVADHWAYLDRIGTRGLLTVARDRSRRA